MADMPTLEERAARAIFDATDPCGYRWEDFKEQHLQEARAVLALVREEQMKWAANGEWLHRQAAIDDFWSSQKGDTR